MAVKGMSTCAHCRALISTPICPICGKSIHDEVEVEDLDPVKRTMATEDRRRVIGFATFVFVAIIASVGAYVVLNRETPEATPTLLAAPTETTSTIRTEGDAPTVTRPDGPVEPLPTFETGAEREVGTGANPWRGAVPRNVLNGDLLPDADYGPGIDAVAAMLADTPDGWTFAAAVTLELHGVAVEAAETSQPFAARSIVDENGDLGEIWIFARGPSTTDASAALLADAQAKWPVDLATETFSPEVGVRIHLLADNGSQAIWLDERDDALVVFVVASGTDPGRVGALAAAWR